MIVRNSPQRTLPEKSGSSYKGIVSILKFILQPAKRGCRRNQLYLLQQGLSRCESKHCICDSPSPSTETAAPLDPFTRTAGDDRMISHKILRSYILIFSLKRTNASVPSRSRLSRPELCHGSPEALQRALQLKFFKLTKSLYE